IAGTIIPLLGPLLVHSYNSLSKIRWILAPKLFLHGDRYEIVSLRFGRRLFAAAQGPKTFWIVEGAGHNDIVEKAGPQYRQRLAAFYESIIGL
ncbi:MAG TPA: alpha/beta hydrolase, partial [Bryobacteraceae bacterium]